VPVSVGSSPALRSHATELSIRLFAAPLSNSTFRLRTLDHCLKLAPPTLQIGITSTKRTHQMRGRRHNSGTHKSASFLLVLARRTDMLMNFAFKWKHQDGSIVESSAQGWRSDDPGKAHWLTKMNGLNSSTPAIAPGIRTGCSSTAS
jgi:hypothetical protein